jgi:TPR repeat protein
MYVYKNKFGLYEQFAYGMPDKPVISFCVPYLFHSELDVDKEENSRLGVYWLIKASEQGSIEATNILKQCLETGKGKIHWKPITFLTGNSNSSNNNNNNNNNKI